MHLLGKATLKACHLAARPCALGVDFWSVHLSHDLTVSDTHNSCMNHITESMSPGAATKNQPSEQDPQLALRCGYENHCSPVHGNHCSPMHGNWPVFAHHSPNGSSEFTIRPRSLDIEEPPHLGFCTTTTAAVSWCCHRSPLRR